jgi:hypothetical protein
MTIGGLLFVAGFMLRRIFSPAPVEVFVACVAVYAVAAIIFAVGCCLYCRGIGYPACLVYSALHSSACSS